MLRLQKPLLFPAQGVFFPRAREDQELENHAVEPVIKETERMVYVAFSEYFFDSAMHAYFQAGVLAIELQGEKVSSARTGRCLQAGGRAGLCLQGEELHPASSSAGINSNHSPSSASASSSPQVPKDLEVLLRATFFGTIFMQV